MFLNHDASKGSEHGTICHTQYNDIRLHVLCVPCIGYVEVYGVWSGTTKGQKALLGAPLVLRYPRPCRRALPSAGASRELRGQAPHQEDMPQQQLPPLANDTIPAGVYTTSRE